MRYGLIFCAAAIACGAPIETTPPPIAAMPSALLGTGLEEFVALADGDELAVEQGYQGGFHLTVNVRVEGLDEDRTTVIFEGWLLDESAVEACRGAYHAVALAKTEDGRSFAAGARCYVADPAAVTMKRVHLTVEIEGSRGERASDARDIRAGRIIRPY